MEFQTGRQEMIHNLTRGVGLLEEAEFSARRDAEQMAKALVDLRDALSKIEAVHEEAWTKDNFSIGTDPRLNGAGERPDGMECRAAQVPDTVQPGPGRQRGQPRPPPRRRHPLLATQGFGELCRLGLALTWPLAAVALARFGRAAGLPHASLNRLPSWHGLEKSQTRFPTARGR